MNLIRYNLITILNIIDEVYQVLLSLILYGLWKPVVKLLSQTLSKPAFYNTCFVIISISNYLFPLNLFRQRKVNQLKKDIRRYRDTYDRRGIDLYFRLLTPEELIQDKVVLDLGCGVGGKLFELLKFQPQKIVGIDLSKRNICYASELVNDANRKII